MRLLLFGPGYVGSHAAARFEREGAIVWQAGRASDPADVRRWIGEATHIVSTVPPGAEGDPVLATYADALRGRWLGYLSSTGVYGDCGGAWVDEGAPLNGRRAERNAADQAWQALGACVLRLPGIYGPGRSMLDRLRSGQAHRIDLPGQVFSRTHVDDIVAALLLAAHQQATGIFNIADDLPAPQNDLVVFGAGLLGLTPPPLQSIENAGLSAAASAFYAENRRVSNERARRLLGWRPRYTDYRAGLRALIATTSPASTSAPPTAASADQR